MNIQVAERMNHIKGSVIRQFAEAALKPGLITFANGNPSPVTFPVEYMKRFYQEALETGDNSLFTYGAVLGYPPLVEALKKRLAAKYGFDFEKNDLFIVSGGTQAVDLVSKLWLEKGDGVIVEEPSYASCYNIFLAYNELLLLASKDHFATLLYLLYFLFGPLLLSRFLLIHIDVLRLLLPL